MGTGYAKKKKESEASDDWEENGEEKKYGNQDYFAIF